MTRFRGLLLSLAVIAVASFAAASVKFYRPAGTTDRALAVESLKGALAALNDEALNPEARLTAYREGLSQTEVLLRRALHSNPVETASIERLATVRWEAGVIAGSPDSDSVASLVDIAATRAPRVPEIQADLGSLLYKMGNPDAAAPFMKRAVELSPAITSRVVVKMLDAGIGPGAIADTLPQTLELVLALRGPFGQLGEWSRWLASVEVLLPDYPGELLWPYSGACLSANAAERLLAHAEALGVLHQSAAEAKRQIAIGRAQLSLKEFGRAGSAAVRARALAPTDTSVLDYAGQIAFSAGDHEAAESSFHEAIRALALEGGRNQDRARLYRQHGQALERLGRVEEAFDEYRRAIELLPDDPWLRERYNALLPNPLPHNN